MVLKILYAVAALLVVAVAVQFWTGYRTYAYLEQGSLTQSYGAAPGKADITVLLFTDYTCGLCRDSNAAIMQAVSEKSNARLIIHPVPQGTEASTRAARIALAAAKQGGFTAMNEVLMRNERPLTDDVVRELAGRVKLDADRMLVDSNGDDITQRLNRVAGLLPKIGVRGVPTLVFNRKFIFVPTDGKRAYGDTVQLIRKAGT